ncbi:hypothetical protein MEBOL_001133 [Melittangium boletus DSM 14713]|uniref:Uncharacterized protein n=1 Tax=Melittangium boletus DSM 14713 TaxID=1294270 RepID=A0A250I739_9BACT|nr:hypothetical protein MEBOL_001133 [Melittangium boletus DSM 14713]
MGDLSGIGQRTSFLVVPKPTQTPTPTDTASFIKNHSLAAHKKTTPAKRS